jgi:hypothetical protein
MTKEDWMKQIYEDETAILPYCDWLEENGWTEEARVRREIHRIGYCPALADEWDPGWAWFLSRNNGKLCEVERRLEQKGIDYKKACIPENIFETMLVAGNTSSLVCEMYYTKIEAIESLVHHWILYNRNNNLT